MTTLSMHAVAVPLLRQLLTALSGVLDKGAAFAEAKKIDPSVLLNARLAPDMFPLTRQVQIATDLARGCVFRLAGEASPSVPDTETTFPELQARLAATQDMIAGFGPDRLDGAETRTVVLKVRSGEMTFTGLDYLVHFVIPNVTFHCTAAYAILRHNGVELGKMDYLGRR